MLFENKINFWFSKKFLDIIMLNVNYSEIKTNNMFQLIQNVIKCININLSSAVLQVGGTSVAKVPKWLSGSEVICVFVWLHWSDECSLLSVVDTSS